MINRKMKCACGKLFYKCQKIQSNICSCGSSIKSKRNWMDNVKHIHCRYLERKICSCTIFNIFRISGSNTQYITSIYYSYSYIKFRLVNYDKVIPNESSKNIIYSSKDYSFEEMKQKIFKYIENVVFI